MNSLRYLDFGQLPAHLLLLDRPHRRWSILFILFGYPKLTGALSGTVQYMAALRRRRCPPWRPIIAVVMEVPAAILIVLGFFTRPLAVHLCVLHPGHGGDWPPLLGYDRRRGRAEHD